MLPFAHTIFESSRQKRKTVILQNRYGTSNLRHLLKNSRLPLKMLLQQRQDSCGTSSDEESVTGGKNSTEDEGLLLRAVEFCRCQQIYVESGND